MLPPLKSGAVKVTDACAFPAVATVEVGASGYVAAAINDWLAVDDAEPYVAMIWK